MAAYAERWKAGEADRAAACAGASIQWTDRAWHWSAWGPDGSKASDFEDCRDAARYAAESALKRFEKESVATSPGPEVAAARDKGHPHGLRTMLGSQATAKPERDQPRRPEPGPGRNTGHERGLSAGRTKTRCPRSRDRTGRIGDRELRIEHHSRASADLQMPVHGAL